MKVYIARKLERAADHRRFAEALRGRGHEITYDWTTHGPACGSGLRRVSEVAEAEIAGVVSADLVLVLLPGGRGTHFEAGVAQACGIRTIFIASPEDAAALFGDVPSTCAFYHLERAIRLIGDVPELLKLMDLMGPALGERGLRPGLEEHHMIDWTSGRVCRQCGCTDLDCDACVERTGEPCCWVDVDLCSACVPASEVAGG